MWLPVLAVIGGALVGLAMGGRLRRTAQVRFRYLSVLLVGVGFEAAAGWWSLGPLGPAAVVAGYAGLLAFAALNRRVPGIAVAAVGVAANALVTAVNGGMPVRRRALIDAGVAPTSFGPRHHLQTSNDHLTWLDDRIPISWLHTVVSVGDVVLAIGVAVVVARAMQYHGRYRRPGRLARLARLAGGRRPTPVR
jgi:Family of unknown function (DUF5317)